MNVLRSHFLPLHLPSTSIFLPPPFLVLFTLHLASVPFRCVRFSRLNQIDSSPLNYPSRTANYSDTDWRRCCCLRCCYGTAPSSADVAFGASAVNCTDERRHWKNNKQGKQNVVIQINPFRLYHLSYGKLIHMS